MERAIEERNGLVNALINKLNSGIEEYKNKFKKLELPDAWMKIPPHINLKTDKRIKVKDQYFTIKDTGFL